MPRFKIHIQYDGTDFHGWQIQRNNRTIQGELEKVLSKLNNSKKINLIGSGRTDSGVHALDQVAHFDWDTKMETSKIVSALNGNLPLEIRVKTCHIVPNEFHARFSAVQRQYLYQCRTDDFIMDRHYVWRTGRLDIDALNSISKSIIGENDFTSFSKYNAEVENRVSVIYLSEWTEAGSIVNYRVAANRFLHHMVRYLVGTMVQVAKGKLTMTKFQNLLNEPKEDVLVYRAPAQGLFLEYIDYDGADTF
ncbi:MAG: tRNA pseudouridine(38-40) synthase TruA [Fidelibacterota bacterium]